MIWKPNVTVAAVIEQAGRYLLVEEIIDGQAVLNQPAGHLEEGETLPQAVTREVLEETGWRFEPEMLVAIQLYRVPAAALTFLRFAFTGRICGQELNPPFDQGILATHWLTRPEIEARRRNLRSPLVLESLAAYESGRRYPLDILQSL